MRLRTTKKMLIYISSMMVSVDGFYIEIVSNRKWDSLDIRIITGVIVVACMTF